MDTIITALIILGTLLVLDIITIIILSISTASEAPVVEPAPESDVFTMEGFIGGTFQYMNGKYQPKMIDSGMFPFGTGPTVTGYMVPDSMYRFDAALNDYKINVRYHMKVPSADGKVVKVRMVNSHDVSLIPDITCTAMGGLIDCSLQYIGPLANESVAFIVNDLGTFGGNVMSPSDKGSEIKMEKINI